jgi:Virulence-associated protein E
LAHSSTIQRLQQEYANTGSRHWDPLNDSHLAYIATTLDGAEVDLSRLYNALTQTAKATPHHPVRSWCEELDWDGVDRAGKLFARYFSAAPPQSNQPEVAKALAEYLAILSRNFLVTMVARTYEPGTPLTAIPRLLTADDSAVIDGLRALMLDQDWLAEQPPLPPYIAPADAVEGMWGRLIVLIRDLPKLPRELAKLKSFLQQLGSRATAQHRRQSHAAPMRVRRARWNAESRRDWRPGVWAGASGRKAGSRRAPSRPR